MNRQYRNLNIRFVKDSYQILIDIASKYDEESCFTFDVLSCYIGWQTIDEMVSLKVPLGIEVKIKFIKCYDGELQKLFSENNYKITMNELNKVANKHNVCTI